VLRRQKWLCAVAVLGLTAAGCGSSDNAGGSGAAATDAMCVPAPTAALTPAFRKTWDALVASAKAEGKLQIVAGTNVEAAEKGIWQCFGKAYGIDVVVSSGSSSQVNSRILAERTQSRYTVDVAMLGGSGTSTFLKAKAFTPLKPLIVYPDILDRSKWYLDQIPWFDADNQYVTLYITTILPNVLNLYYNPDKVSKADLDGIQSLNDLLQPRWKGKLVIGDVADGESDTESAQGWLKLGQDYYDKLIKDMDVGVVPLGAARQYTDGIVRGQWEIGLFGEFAISDIVAAQKEGLPIETFTRTLSEGPWANVEGQVGIFDHAANPAAAQLFVNWLLSQQGQTVYNALVDTDTRANSQSFRRDVPQGNIKEEDWNRIHAAGFTLTHDPVAFAQARQDAVAHFKNLFTAQGITP
jgi:iron(III) transport system substrate-binding protein